MSPLRLGDRAASSAGQLKWLQLLIRRRRNAVGRKCSTNFPHLFIQLCQMPCVTGRFCLVIGQKHVLGGSLVQLATTVAWWRGMGADRTTAFCVSSLWIGSSLIVASLVTWQRVK